MGHGLENFEKGRDDVFPVSDCLLNGSSGKAALVSWSCERICWASIGFVISLPRTRRPSYLVARLGCDYKAR